MALYDVPAPAKVNLFLHVVGRRPDGYHDLQSVFRYIDLCDRFDFDVRNDGVLEREVANFPELAPADDLVLRAARALQQATGTRKGAQIRYTKHIPSGAGLGGGSSDAATTLIALNRLWNTGLDRDALMALARPLGADVPFFIFGASAFAEGTGDVLTEIALPQCAYLVLRPHGAVSTANVFTDPDLTRNTKAVKISVFADWHTGQTHQKQQNLAQQTEHEAKQQVDSNDTFESGLTDLVEALPGDELPVDELRVDELSGNRLFGRNDLEPVVLARYGAIREMAQALQKEGFRARMTGSGSCFYIEYNSVEQATRAQQKISSKMLDCKHDGPEARHESNEAVVENSWVCPGLLEHPLRHW